MTGAPTTTDWSAAAAIRHHYDVGNAFYRLWLDETMTYSCACPVGPDDSLESAQHRKVALHLDAVGAAPGVRVLDVGCGWGAALLGAVDRGASRAVGLTLSPEQAAHVQGLSRAGVEVRVEDWTDHEPDAPYDGIVSVGALEHFARPEEDDATRRERYRAFLARAVDWLAPGGLLSLQTIAYGSMTRDEASAFIQQEIFPAADLPTTTDLVAAAECLMEVRTLRNDRLDYAWTCERWAERLRSRRAEAVALVGEETTARYERYLRQSALGFRMGRIGLLRLVLAPHGRPWTGRRRAAGG